MRGLLALLIVTFGLCLAGPVVAQGLGQGQVEPATGPAVTAIDYDAWEAEATRAVNLIDAGTASTAFFENLRSTLAAWRAQFLAAENANATRIRTIQAQIDALGLPPEEGVEEPLAIADRRAALTAQLAEAQAPRLVASEAFNRANGLISEIDVLLSARQQEALLSRSPSPANPVNWTTTLAGLADLTISLQSGVARRIADPIRQETAIDNAPLAGFLFVIGLVMLLRGRGWLVRLARRFDAYAAMRGHASAVFLASLIRLGLSIVAVGFIVAALRSTGFLTLDASALVDAFAAMLVVIFCAIWLGGQVFPEDAPALGVLEFDAAARASARRTVFLIGVTVGIGLVLETIAEFDAMPPAAQGVFLLPVVVTLAMLFLQASRQLRLSQPEAEEDSSNFARTALALVARGLSLVAVIGPVLALIGYVNAAEALMTPAALSLGVVGILVALQPVIRDLYAVAFRTSQDAAREALLPVLINFLLVFGALPLLALIWGMRPEQLAEVYARFWEGVPIGEGRVTPGNIFAVIIVFALGFVATRLLQGALRATVLPRTKMDTGARNAITSGVGYVGIGLAALVAITAGGIDLTAIGFVLGALSVGIGFGLQNVVNNFVSGIILLIERPISEGDWVEVGGNMGIVKSISVRSTRIETFDRTDVIVPNADFISGTVTNWTRGNTIGRAIVNVGVAYGTDTRRVEKILREIVDDLPGVAKFPEPGVDFMGFGADSLDFRVRAILRNVNDVVPIKTELHHRIAERFVAEGIEIPFAQRDIWLRNPETLTGPRAAPDPDATAMPDTTPDPAATPDPKESP